MGLGNKEIFAKNLRRYMEMNEKTRNDICKDLGFSYTTFSDWYNGKKYPRIDKIEMLASYCGILKSDLVEDKLMKLAEETVRYQKFSAAYDKLDKDDQDRILLIMYSFLESSKYKEKNTQSEKMA